MCLLFLTVTPMTKKRNILIILIFLLDILDKEFFVQFIMEIFTSVLFADSGYPGGSCSSVNCIDENSVCVGDVCVCKTGYRNFDSVCIQGMSVTSRNCFMTCLAVAIQFDNELTVEFLITYCKHNTGSPLGSHVV